MPGPAPTAPMKATPADRLPTGDGWAFEVKWDGYRTVTAVDVPAGTATMWSSNGLDLTGRFGGCVVGLPAAVHGTSAVLDGEVIAFGPDGRPSFQALQSGTGPLAYLVFDLLALNGHDTCELAYRDRRRLLRGVLDDGAGWRVAPWQIGDGAALWSFTAAEGHEGVIAKRLDSRYEPGRRSAAWIKVKHVRRQEFVVGGWLPGTGTRAGTVGALLVGVHRGVGGPLRYAGRVGTGFTQAALRTLHDRLRSLEVPGCPFADGVIAPEVRRRGRWVQPELVAEVGFAEWTDEALLRHPRFVGLRDDRPPASVVRET